MSQTIGFIVTEDKQGNVLSTVNVYKGQNLMEALADIHATAPAGTYVFAERIVFHDETEVVASTGEVMD